jgi:BirA family biotin operon repressor/biotin-[acetyl-CoA-carboxylase] ligase
MHGLRSLSPANLADYVQNVELPSRIRDGGSDTERVFCYGAFVGSVLHCYSSLDRAMDTAREHIRSSELSGTSVANGTVILASSLNASKGRFSRSWHAPPGGLWGCLLLADIFLAPFRNFLPLIPGIACCEALHQFGASTAAIRWVNDVLLQGKKQAGFLIEGFRSPVHGEHYHLLGFGINLNNNEFPAVLQDSAGSLAQFLGHSVDIESFALSFFAKLQFYVGLLLHEEERWLQAGGGEEYEGQHPLLIRWKELSDTVGKRVQFGYDVMENPQYTAMVEGVAGNGALLLRHDDGSCSREQSGEIRYCVGNKQIAG